MRNKVHFLLLCILFILGILLGGCSNKIETNMSESMVAFEFANQDKETVSLEDLKGDWWISYFSYTNCKTVCPRTTANMVDVQKELKEKNVSPQIISFSVDPENDTPDELKKYAEEYEVDLDSWDFLTGYDFTTIQKVSEEAFRAALEDGAVDQRSHSYMFYLIDPEGDIVKKYDGMSVNEIEMLVDDVKTVLK